MYTSVCLHACLCKRLLTYIELWDVTTNNYRFCGISVNALLRRFYVFIWITETALVPFSAICCTHNRILKNMLLNNLLARFSSISAASIQCSINLSNVLAPYSDGKKHQKQWNQNTAIRKQSWKITVYNIKQVWNWVCNTKCIAAESNITLYFYK